MIDILEWCHENLRRINVRDSEIGAECPWCGRSEAFNVNKRTGAFNCYKCSDRLKSKGKDLVGLVAEVEGSTWKAAREKVYGAQFQWTGGDALSELPSLVEEGPDGKDSSRRIWLMLPHCEPVFDESREPQWRFPKKLTQRGITRDVARLYDLRVCHEGRYAQRLIIPVLSLFGRSFTARALLDDREPRYMNPDNAGHSRLLFGWNVIDKDADLVICEGPFDVMRLRVHGVQAVALMGKSLSKDQETTLRMLLPSTSITLMIDPEERHAQYAIARRLSSHFRQIRIAKLPEIDGRPIDPGDSTKEQAEEAMRSSILYEGESSSIDEMIASVKSSMISLMSDDS
jgi:hypothetical protein